MPCPSCNEIFNHIKPCNASKYSQDELKKEFENSTSFKLKLSGSYVNIKFLLFQQLQMECPCKECLVRPICDKRCKKYENLLDAV